LSNVINAVIASLDSCKSSQVSILISKRIARGALVLRTENFENLWPRAPNQKALKMQLRNRTSNSGMNLVEQGIWVIVACL